MLASVETVVNDLDGEDDPLDDDGSLKEQLEKLPTLCRFLYEGAGKMILDHFDTIKVRYQQLHSRTICASEQLLVHADKNASCVQIGNALGPNGDSKITKSDQQCDSRALSDPF